MNLCGDESPADARQRQTHSVLKQIRSEQRPLRRRSCWSRTIGTPITNALREDLSDARRDLVPAGTDRHSARLGEEAALS
jgi:hypothetical protein